MLVKCCLNATFSWSDRAESGHGLALGRTEPRVLSQNARLSGLIKGVVCQRLLNVLSFREFTKI